MFWELWQTVEFTLWHNTKDKYSHIHKIKEEFCYFLLTWSFHDDRPGKIRDYSGSYSVYILEHCASQPTSWRNINHTWQLLR